MTRRAAAGALAVLAALTTAACTAGGGGSGTSSSASASSSASSSAAPTSAPTTAPTTVTQTVAPTTSAPSSSAPPSTPSPTPSSSVGAASAACGNDELSITAGTANGATGHDGYVLSFRNTARRTCTLHGYPGLDALRPGHPATHATRTLSGFMGGSRHGLPTVHLRPGRAASARVEYTFADNRHPGGNCPTARRVAVTAANTTRAVTLSAPATICNLQVHPTVPGTSGDDD